MEKKYFISSAFVALIFLASQKVYGMQDDNEEQKNSPKRQQLVMLETDTLGSILGLGDNTILKMSMNLKDLKTTFEKKRLKIPTQLFLTDFNLNHPADYPVVNLNIKVDCEATDSICVLPSKPQSFESYSQFTDWLNQGYITNKVKLTYDFHIDVRQSAPNLVQYLSDFRSEGYHFMGVHEIVSDAMKPNRCEPKLTYTSERGKINTTTVKLGGTFWYNYRHSTYDYYDIEDHEQVFPHPVIKQTSFEKKCYSPKSLAQAEVTEICYSEFPKSQTQSWPKAPSGTYHVLRKEYVSLEDVHHVTCWDGNSGEEIDIANIWVDGKFLPIIREAIQDEDCPCIENIVKGDDESLYIVRYQDEAEFQKRWAHFEEKESNINEMINLGKELSAGEPFYFAIQKTLDSLEIFSSTWMDSGLCRGERCETSSLLDGFRESATSLMRNYPSAVSTYNVRSRGKEDFFNKRAALSKKMKEDIIEGMELYQQLFGQNHPRLSEVKNIY